MEQAFDKPFSGTIDLSRLIDQSCIQSVEWLECVDSTNDRALIRARDPLLETPCLIGTDRQTAGRGRGANVWWGAEGSLMFSVIVDMPSFGLSAADWPRFSLVTGLAISDTLATFLIASQIGLKWPNDVWLNGRKVCGILIEQGDRLPDRLVIGIGWNVNNSFAMAPDEQRQIATSMYDESRGATFSRTEVIIAFVACWRRLIQQLADDQLNLAERWSHACVLSGRPVLLTSGNLQTTGVCTGIDADGALLLRTAFTLERHYAGTVKLLDFTN